MILQRLLVLLFLPLFAFLVCSSAVCNAMDPRFELDPAQVKKNTRLVHREKPVRGSSSRRSHRGHRTGITLQKNLHEQATSTLSLSAQAPGSAVPDVKKVRLLWDSLVPAGSATLQPLSFKSETFDLTIDPSRYPLLKAADGGTILLDTDGSLPPLVKTLIQEKDKKLRVVNAATTDAHRFLGALLLSGGFYSVEEQPVMVFGKDPQLTVKSDFKVELNAESVMHNEVELVSAARQGLPLRLSEYLKTQGFRVSEPFADHTYSPVPLRHRVVRTSEQGQVKAVDLVLETLGVPTERRRRVELFKAAETGVGLSVSAERYFERNGKRFVVTRFTGDPIAYTLFRLLETKGYQVVILEPHDGFKAVATKLLSRMDLPASYTSQLLLADPAGRYTFEMSGFMLENAASGGGAVMLTDRPIDNAMRELLYDHGYQVQER